MKFESEHAAAQSQITNVYWKTLPELINPAGKKTQALNGFDDEFVDIVDYIIRITYRIWEQKNIGDCYRYYADYCPVHTLGGYSDDVQTVVKNTLLTVAAFPDRSLLGENVVWRELGQDGYYSSHRITSIMTNKGDSEFGAATGKTGRVTTIADCICKENKIVYEWLMRDNSFLVKQLGIDVIDAAEYMSESPSHPQFIEWLAEEVARVKAQHETHHQWQPAVNSPLVVFAQDWIESLFNNKLFSRLAHFYAIDANVQWPGGRETVGLPGISGIFIQWLAQCPDAVATCDHVAVTAFDDNGGFDVAVRWSLVGTFHSVKPRLAKLSGQTFFVLGGSHLRLKGGRIQEEWTVFDEVAALANLFRNYKQSGSLEDGGYQGA